MRRMHVGLLILVLCAAGSTARAGDCTIAGGKVDLNVLFLYDETDLEGWKPVFTEASKLLYNATEGNLQIGKVRFFVSCQPAKDKADFWISTGTGGASAHADGCGRSGWHAFFSNIHKRNDATAHGQLGMVHELGHYIFDLADEYGGCVKDGTTALDPPGTQYMWQNGQVTITAPAGERAFYCSMPSGGSTCIMDAGTTVTSAFTRTEFCTSANHLDTRTRNVTLSGVSGAADRALENNQECKHGKECWDLVKTKLGLSAVPAISTSMPSGHEDLVFEDIGAASRFVLMLDRSGSMSGDPIALARTAAGCFVANSRLPRTEFNRTVPGDEIGVVSFASSTSVNSALSELTTAADKTAKQAAISGISAGGATNIGGGLRTALTQLTGAGTPGCIEAIVLLSDGQHNTGESPSSVLPDIVARKAVVFSIGLGSGADLGTLTSAASTTGGKFFFASGAGDLPAIFAEIQATVTGSAILDRVKRTLSEAGADSFGVLVDSSEGNTIFSFNGTGVDVTLTSPSGAVSNDTIQAPGVIYALDGPVQTFTVAGPELGLWVVDVVNEGSSAVTVDLVVSSPSLGTHLQGEAPASVDFGAGGPAQILVRAALSQGPGVAGASVGGEVLRPDGSTVPLTLFDDGAASHGDGEPNDGIYSTRFSSFAGDGAYTFFIRADTAGANLVSGEDGPDAGAVVPAALATRATTVTTTVTGAPVGDPCLTAFSPGPDLDGDGVIDDCDEAIFSTGHLHAIANGGSVLNLYPANLYVAPPGGPVALATPNFQGANIDAVDTDGDSLIFSVDANGYAPSSTGLVFLRRANVYRHDPSAGTITPVLDWNALGIPVSGLQSISALADGSFLFSLRQSQSLPTPAGAVYARPWEIYRVDPAGAPVVERFYDAGALGFADVDALDVLYTGQLGISSSSTFFVPSNGGVMPIRHENVYLIDPDTGGMTTTFDGAARGVESLDAFSFGSSPLAFEPDVPPTAVVFFSGGVIPQLDEAAPAPVTYSLSLTAAPASTVTVHLEDPDGQLVCSPSEIVFTAADFDVPREVQVTVVDDTLAEGGVHQGVIRHVFEGADARYVDAPAATVVFDIVDDDTGAGRPRPLAEGTGGTPPDAIDFERER